MRLINAVTHKINEFLSEPDIPPFAILSHTWGPEECTLQQMEDPAISSRKGYRKIALSCVQAQRDGLEWVWVDTCCIDKSSTAELSEAINSMFRWYRNAEICYAYLSDVKGISELARSRWFTRGWTLQELVAPKVVHLYDVDWDFVGSKHDLRISLSAITNIEEDVLDTGAFEHISIARRMSWAANRQTTRIEDGSYCLLGLFNVNMPLLYGEGKKAFTRLQEEILKVSDDHSLFAWGLSETPRTWREFLMKYEKPDASQLYGLFARSPSDFTLTHDIRVLEDQSSLIPPIVSNSGVRIELQVLLSRNDSLQIAAIFCTMERNYESYLGFPLLSWGRKWRARVGELVLIPACDLATETDPFRKPEPCLIKQPPSLFIEPRPQENMKIVLLSTVLKEDSFKRVACSPYAVYSERTKTIKLPAERNELHAVIFFDPNLREDYSLRLIGNDAFATDVRKEMDLARDSYPSQISAHSSRRHGPSFTFTQPPFAILLGGNMIDPWIECVVVLSDGDSNQDFHRVSSEDPGLVRRCATREQLQYELRNSRREPLVGKREMHVRSKVAFWRYEFGSRNGRQSKIRATGGLFVDATLESASTNLVDGGLFLYLKTVKDRIVGDRAGSRDQKPPWWRLP